MIYLIYIYIYTVHCALDLRQCTCIRTYVHTYIQTDRQTASQPGRQAGRQAGRHACIHTYIHTCSCIPAMIYHRQFQAKLTWRRQNDRHLDKTCSKISKLRKEVEPNRVCCVVTCGTPAGLADLCGSMGKLFPELEPSVLAAALRHNKRDFSAFLTK